MHRWAALLIGLLFCLLQLAPAAPTAVSLAVMVIAAALVLAACNGAASLRPVPAVSSSRRLPPGLTHAMRQYAPATAGRPQPRAPGRAD